MYNLQRGHACKYKGGKCLEGNPGINHQPPFLDTYFLLQIFASGKGRHILNCEVCLPAQVPIPSPAQHPLSSRCLGAEGWGGGQISPHPPHPLAFSAFTFPIPHFSLLASQRRLILRNGSDLGLEAETNQLPF